MAAVTVTTAIDSLQFGVGQLNLTGRIAGEQCQLLGTQAVTVGGIFPGANDIKFHVRFPFHLSIGVVGVIFGIL
jgi:hypothetical protein